MSTSQAERNIYIVNPRIPGNITLGPNRLGVPMGLGVVASGVEHIRDKAGFGANEASLQFIDENLGQEVDSKPGDLVFVSTFSSARGSVLTLIRKVNKRKGLVVVGGIHATVAPDDFTREGAISFQGEAGNSFVFNNLMNQWLQSGELDRGQKIESEGLVNPKAIDLAGLPVSAEVYKQLDDHSRVRSTFATMGCPYDCGFCTVMAGRIVRKRPVGEIAEEIKLRGLDKSGFALADSNLGAGGDDYLHELLGEFARLEIPRGWTSEISINLLDRGGDELCDSLAKAHCHRLFIGIESPNAENLSSVGKKHNLAYDSSKVREIVNKAHQRGIKITGLFIVGFPTETVESIAGIEQYIKDTQLDGANIFILTPLPGAKIWDEFAAQGLFDPQTLNTDDLDLRHMVFQHPLGNDKLLQEYERLCRRVFSAPAVISRATRAFFMAREHHLPENLQQAALSSFGAEILQADQHRKLGLVNLANRVYDAWRRLSG